MGRFISRLWKRHSPLPTAREFDDYYRLILEPALKEQGK
jgi:hypothetical protein